jgi:putative DNA primase/helicase
VQPATAEDVNNRETVEKLAFQIWGATVAGKVLSEMSAFMDELLESHLLDDDDEEVDEEADEGFDDRHKREKKLLDEAIADALETYPDIKSINNLPPSSDPDVVQGAEQLKDVLTRCPIGATRIKDRLSRPQLERRVKIELEKQFKKDPKCSEHIRADVPGRDIKKYGGRGCTSSKGTFAKSAGYLDGGGLTALLTGGWTRVAKDRIEPVAWSYRYGFARKSEQQSWQHHFLIIERNGKQSPHELPAEKLAGTGASAIQSLMKAGVQVVAGAHAQRGLIRFLHFKPKQEIVRMPRVGWAQVESSHWVFVRPDEVITPPGMPQARYTTYALDTAVTQHGLHVAGTTAEWAAEIATPLRGNSNVALSLGTFLAAPLLRFASEPGGGNHFFGHSTIGKSMCSAVGQSIYGWPYETADDAFGVSWGGSEAGFDALALARTDLGLPLDEITLANPRTAEQVVYKIASGTKGPRATSSGHLRETAHAPMLVLSTGEKSLPQFIKGLQEGARKRLIDIPAEVQPGSAFETIPPDRIHIEGKRLFDAMKRQHGAVGRDWQRYLVALGPDSIKAELQKHREAFLALPDVVAVTQKAHPQVRAVVNRFALTAAALRMAIEANLLPWTVEEADAGIVACMRRWAAQRGNLDEAGELMRAADEVVARIKAALPDRFIAIHKQNRAWEPVTEADAAKQKTPELFDGYVKPEHILVRPEVFERLCNGLDREIANLLQQQGSLTPSGKGERSRAEQVVGKVERFVVLSLTP